MLPSELRSELVCLGASLTVFPYVPHSQDPVSLFLPPLSPRRVPGGTVRWQELQHIKVLSTRCVAICARRLCETRGWCLCNTSRGARGGSGGSGHIGVLEGEDCPSKRHQVQRIRLEVR